MDRFGQVESSAATKTPGKKLDTAQKKIQQNKKRSVFEGASKGGKLKYNTARRKSDWTLQLCVVLKNVSEF